MQIEKTDIGYRVKDYTQGEQTRFHQVDYSWISEWDHEMNMISLYMNDEDTSEILRDKDHWHYHRVVRAKSRHLRSLKEHIGIIQPKENREKRLFTLDKSLSSRIMPIRIQKGMIHNKTVEIYGSRKKKESVFCVEVTPENERKMREYNEKLKEFLQYQKEMMIDIFGEEQIKSWQEPSLFLYEQE
ncbi:hypothetical protein ACFVS2_25040 [Brevibacillus sp. NPDC058079]|uniref:hypothetical protein n=1 Tax=Brevibacillus sp. NPDC058079 TaxID=3346330 RepID=UPI0036EC52DD